MLKFKVLGSGEYLRKGIQYLKTHGYEPCENADLLICLAYPEILKKKEIAKYPLGVINFHCGLPNYRGRHPLQWMLIDGVSEIPVAVHFIDEGIDTGPILIERTIKTMRDETYASALEKVTDMVGFMVLEAMERIAVGGKGTPQDKSALPKPRRTPFDSEFTFDAPSVAIHRFINAMSDPMPNAFTGRAAYSRSYSGERPGQILVSCDDGRQVISTQDGVVLVRPV